MNQNIHITNINDASFAERGISAGMLRLDLFHPIVSGNKIFKLSPYFELASEKGFNKIVTKGGPYSNHLHATAYAASQRNMRSVGILRGAVPAKPSVTLSDCIQLGMEIIFIKNDEYDQLGDKDLEDRFPDSIIIPQGGYGIKGMLGAAEIMKIKGVSDYNIIMAACGTGTMGAGLIIGGNQEQKIILVSVLKNNLSIKNEIDLLINNYSKRSKYSIEHGFHLGGYARKNMELFKSMNDFYQRFSIPTDFVYTGKMVYAFEKLVMEERFPKGSKILLIHSGGLQGNRSLDCGELIYTIKDYL